MPYWDLPCLSTFYLGCEYFRWVYFYDRVHQIIWFYFSSFIFLFLWFGLSMHALTAYKLYRGDNVSSQYIWHETYKKIGSIFGAGLKCMFFGLAIVVVCILLQEFVGWIFKFNTSFIITIIGYFYVLIYFFVRWSLIHQGIMIDNLSSNKSFRRSSQLIKGNWFKYFGRFLLILWVSTILLNLVTVLALVLMSYASSQLIPIREELLSPKCLTLIFGIPIKFTSNDITLSIGYLSSSLDGTPKFWTVYLLIVVWTFVYALLLPLWGILTTHIYLERTEGETEKEQTSENAIIV